MWLGALLAVVVLGFPLAFVVGLVHGVQRTTEIGVERGNDRSLVQGPAVDSRDQVEFSRGDERRSGVTRVPRIAPFVGTCLVLVVALLAIALAIGLAEH
jgi:hypothetical protein